MGADAIASGYAELLSRHHWHQFGTFTFRPKAEGRHAGMHPEAADKAFRFYVSCLNRELYGPKWATRWHQGIQWARGDEFHKDGRIHFHALFAAAAHDLNGLMSRYAWHEWWFKQFGRNQIERPRSQLDIAGYVSKYVSKGGEVALSRNFGAWLPPLADFSAVPKQTAISLADQL